MGAPFLTARWEDLVLLNFACPEALLRPLVPAGLQLDDWQGTHLVSLVGFRFRDTRLKRLRVPCHVDFDEVNLRFYVWRTLADGEVRRAVVFIRELVPRRAVALVARRIYNEPYLVVPMSHDIALDAANGGHVRYRWRHRGGASHIEARVTGPARPLENGSQAEFITEHYWGYTRQRDGGTLEYQVEHPSWHVWQTEDAHYVAPTDDSLYGPAFTAVLNAAPVSAFVSVGSEVRVFPGQRVT